jgi:DUF3102 family protein
MGKALQIKPGSALDRKAKQIARLYSEICGAARISLARAIEIGGILNDVHESPAFKGLWLKWLEASMPFSQKTAWRYMQYWKHRAELVNLTNLSEADGLILALPEGKSRKRPMSPAEEQLVETGIARDAADARRLLKAQAENQTSEHETEPVPGPVPVSVSVVKLQDPKGWTPEPLKLSDLTFRERAAIKRLLDSTPFRRRTIIRAICEGGLLG